MEQIGLLVLFALVGLFQMLVRWLRQRAAEAAETAAPPAPPPPALPRATPMPPVEEILIRAPEPARALERAYREGASTAIARPRPARTVFSTRSQLRRAIVLRDILGPCRAMDPPNGGPEPSRRQQPG
ncbi:MAG: hypothetical protein FJ027_14555 [Candidatus Rokubacteria bacterium]|nr:hypothetical protein [Candidatus Rokubacteria bacterium]